MTKLHGLHCPLPPIVLQAPLLVLRNLRPEPRGSLLNINVTGDLAAAACKTTTKQFGLSWRLGEYIGYGLGFSADIPWRDPAANRCQKAEERGLLSPVDA